MAGSTLRELVVRLGFKVDNSELKKFEKSVDNLKTGLIAITGVAVAAAAGLFAITLSASKAGEELQANADLVGMSVEAYQRYAHAASLAELSNEGFQTSLQFLSRNIGNALQGNKGLVESFGRLGLSVNDLKTLKTEQVLERLQSRFQSIQDPSERAAMAVQIFGRSGARMGRFLSLSTEQTAKANAVIEAFGFFTADSAKAADDAGDSFSMVGTLITGLKNSIGIKLFPILKKISDAIVDWTLANKDLIRVRTAEFVDVLVRGLTIGWKIMAAILKVGLKLINFFGGLANVTKIAGIALLAVFGASLYATIVSAIIIVKALGVAFITAWLSALWPAALVALAIAAIILVIDDLYTWIKGGDSVLGAFFGTWESFAQRIKDSWTDLKEYIKLAWEGLKSVFSGVIDIMQGAWGVFTSLLLGDVKKFEESFKMMVGGIKESIKGLLDIIPDWLPRLLSMSGSIATAPGTQQYTAAYAGLGGGASPFGGTVQGTIARPLAGAVAGTVNQINVDAKVSVPAGTTEQQATFMENAMKDIAERVFGRQVEHVMQTNPRRE